MVPPSQTSPSLNGKWWWSHKAVNNIAPGKQDRGTDLWDPVWQVEAAPGQTQRLPGAHREKGGERRWRGSG